MDCAIHWGVIRYLKDDINAKGWIPVVAIVLDLLALVGFCWVKLNSDPFVLVVALITMVLIALGEVWFLRSATRKQEQHESHSHEHHHS